MTKEQLGRILERSERYIQTHQYYDVLYIFCKIVALNTKLYDRVTLDTIKRPITCNQLLLELYDELQSKADNNNAGKGLFCIYIGISLNNISVYNLVPQDIDSVKSAVNRQKIAISFFNQGMTMLYKSEVLLKHDDNNTFNYALSILEFNYVLQMGADTTSSEVEINMICRRIRERLEILIKLNPTESSYKLMLANLVCYTEGEKKAEKLYKDVITTSSQDYRASVEAMQLRFEYKDTAHRAVIFKM